MCYCENNTVCLVTVAHRSVVHLYEIQFYNWIYTNFGNTTLKSHWTLANIVAFFSVDFMHYWSHRWTHGKYLFLF